MKPCQVKRQIAARSGKSLRANAANSGKFVAAFYCFLPLGFWPRFFPTISLGDGVILPHSTYASSIASFFIAA